MAILKCKMCGGDLNIDTDVTVAECEYCGTKQTVPTIDDDKKVNLFSRANRLRFACEFDKAAGVYESILADFPEEAEAYWGLILCKYGIEYVDDPATAKKIPTCHRSSFDSVFDDSNFELVMENADAVARTVYRDEAKQIEELRKGIIEVSSKEEPYDIFICYKETAENGDRTVDSVIAQDVYTELTNKGYRVFFSRISLEDKLGVEYEPYIFAALNSAKIMLAFGTDYEYYNAVWVKNEWSRFLQLIAKGEKKTLIPCYKDIDAYDMPKEFAKLQAQDMGKVGAIQDLLRGIEKILPKETAKTETVVVQQSTNNPSVDSLLERAFMFLEDGDWKSADEYCEKVLDIDPKCAKAYLGKLMAELKVSKEEDLSNQEKSFENRNNYQKALRFADDDLSNTLNKHIMTITDMQIKQKNIYERIKFVKNLICSGYSHIVAVKTNRTVVAAGNNEYGQCDMENWVDINGVVAYNNHTVGLKKDGTVVATGDNEFGQCNVETWYDITAVAAGGGHTVGLKKDGTVVATGDNEYDQCDIETWTEITAVTAGDWHTVALKKDGTVVATGDNEFGQCNVKTWSNITEVIAGGWHTIGIKKDGTVIATGDNKCGQCDINSWTDIVTATANGWHTVGLKKDGTVVATGDNKYGQCNVETWTDIVATAAGGLHTIGLKKDGTIVATIDSKNNQINIESWKLFNNLALIEQEQTENCKKFADQRKAILEKQRKAELEKQESQRKFIADRKAHGVCLYCGGVFKGLFTKKCTNCGKVKDY